MKPLPPRTTFLALLARNFAIGVGIILFGLTIGVVGYHRFAGLSWLDALLNAAMILTGMGPVDVIISRTGKLFATFYALFSGIAFVSTVAVLFAPIVARFLHRFHLEFSGATRERDDPEQRVRTLPSLASQHVDRFPAMYSLPVPRSGYLSVPRTSEVWAYRDTVP